MRAGSLPITALLVFAATGCLTRELERAGAQGLPHPVSKEGGASPMPFPYHAGLMPPVPRYARHRPERRPSLVCAFRALDYLLKYARKHRAAPAEELDYFARQRQVLRTLAAEPAGGADVSLAAAGDLMWLRSGWQGFLAPEVLDYLNGHDVVVGNLETMVARSLGVPWVLPERAVLRLNSRPELVTSFRRQDGRNTFTALTLANNHSLDYGERGARETMEFLEQQGILHTGLRVDGNAPAFAAFSAKGMTIGLCAFTWGLSNRRGLAGKVRRVECLAPLPGEPLDVAPIRAALDAMERAGVDFRVVAVHWGFEYELYPDPAVVRVAHEIVRAGADLVVGTHPHVVQPAEVCFLNGYERCYDGVQPPSGCLLTDPSGQPRKALVLYSLGNFATAMTTLLCQAGAIQSLRLRRDPATGRVDWFAPRTSFSYNVHRHPASGTRRLVLLRSYLAEGHAGKLPRRDKEDLELLLSLAPEE